MVLSLGAIHTPKVLMQSGIGDEAELQRLLESLCYSTFPVWVQNFQDHVAFDCVWEYQKSTEAQQHVRGNLLLDEQVRA